MSVISVRLPLQQFYRSGPMPCPYLPGRVERKLFTRLDGAAGGDVNSALTRAGFRRSHDIVYRPICEGCHACVPVRIPVARFAPDRTMRRLLRANADLAVGEEPATARAEHFRLFAAYEASRHADSDMARMTFADYAAMIEEGRTETGLLTLRRPDGQLAGAALFDRLADGLSAVYSFFDAREPRRSLGTQLILALVEHARATALPHVYLGYWIAGSRKMAYKSKFRPLEALTGEGWRTLPE